MYRRTRHALVAVAAAIIVTANSGQRSTSEFSVDLSPRDLPRIATIDDRYESYNIEMAEVIGGNFWKPYDQRSIAALEAQARAPAAPGAGIAVGQDTGMFQKRAPIDLTNPRLRKLAAALGPAYVRVSGTWANSVYFHDADTPAPSRAPKGYDGVLTKQQWKG